MRVCGSCCDLPHVRAVFYPVNSHEYRAWLPLVRILSLFVLYFCCARVAFLLKVDNVSMYWPGNAIAVMLLNAASSQLEFCLQLVAFLPAYLLSRISIGVTEPGLIFWLAAANFVEILIGTLAMRTFLPVNDPLTMVKEMRFIAVTVGFFSIIGSILATTIASFALKLFYDGYFWEYWVSWLFGDLAGGYSTMYVLYVFIAYYPDSFYVEDAKKLFSGSLIHALRLAEYSLVGLLLGTIFLWSSEPFDGVFTGPLWLLPVPAVGWIAFRYHQLYSAIMDTWLMVLLVTSAKLRRGPLVVLLDSENQVGVYATMHLLALISTITADFVSVGRVQYLERELSQKKDMEDKLNLFQHISHEFRTPLSIMLGFAEQVRSNEMLSEQGRMDMDHVIVAAKGMNRLVDDLLEVFRLDARAFVIDYQPVDLCQVISFMEQMLQKLATEKDIQMSVSYPPELACTRVMSDPSFLGRIFMNLGSNAIKYTPKGGRVVIVVNCPRSDLLKIEVADTGMGINPEDLPHIFDEFYRCANLQQAVKGTGLGLSVVKKTIVAMGGTILVSSEVGRGSCFTVELPVSQLEQDFSESTIAAANRMVGRTSSSAVIMVRGSIAGMDEMSLKCDILVIEDSLLNSKLLCRILEKMGHTVTAVPDGEAALAEFESRVEANRPLNLVMLDLGLPTLPGIEVLRRMRTSGGWLATVPVVITSATTVDSTRQDCLKAGCNGFMPKPFDVVSVSRVISELMHSDELSAGSELGRLSQVSITASSCPTDDGIENNASPQVHQEHL